MCLIRETKERTLKKYESNVLKKYFTKYTQVCQSAHIYIYKENILKKYESKVLKECLTKYIHTGACAYTHIYRERDLLQGYASKLTSDHQYLALGSDQVRQIRFYKREKGVK